MLQGGAMRIHTIPHSTNAERPAIAPAPKGVTGVEWGVPDPGDRAAIRELSGQALVPVVEHGGAVLVDSMPIITWIEERWPSPPLYPTDPLARREVEGFITWFNHVWKVPPNAMDDALREGTADPL